MALPINIVDLINRRVIENARVEYKKSWNPQPILHSICAFANDIDNWGGGYIIIGIEEENGMPKFPIKGLEKTSIDRINKDLLQKCNLLEPRYIPVVEHTIYQGADIIILWVPGGDARPYKCPVAFPSEKSAKYDKAYYIRKMSSSIRANQMDEKELFMLASNVPFDDRINLSATAEDLKSSLVSEYLYAVNSDLYADSLQRPIAELAADMHLMGGPIELRKPLNVGLMFFNEHPDDFFRYARIEVVDKPNPTGSGMTEKIFSGPIDRQLRDALSYIQNYVLKEKITKLPGHAEAERVFNYPYAAIEEALSNAVYHKSYQIGEPITVTVTPEKLEITSLPGPDRTITDDDISNRRMVSRRYRNRRIGDFLKELKLVEGRNTGIPSILQAMERNGSELPVFETDRERSYFTVVLPIQQKFHPEEKPSDTQRKKARRNIAEIRNLILEVLAENDELSSGELAIAMGYTKVTDAVGRAIRELLSEQKIVYLSPDNPRSRYQKLRLN
ncbi:MAG: ATP-binding protein [Eubacteriales bacterium]|nr:ATP-binding protein [Eubacteriales bacterium]